jgi:hypothetical protein
MTLWQIVLNTFPACPPPSGGLIRVRRWGLDYLKQGNLKAER